MAEPETEEREELPAWSLPADAVAHTRIARRLAGGHSRLGVGRGDRRGRHGLHPRLGDRARPSAGRRGRGGRRRSRSTTRAASPSPSRISTVTSAATEPPAPESSARSHRPVASSARESSAPATRERADAPRGAPLGRRAGIRRGQHEPLDDEEPVRRHAPRARRRGVLRAHRCSSRRPTTCR